MTSSYPTTLGKSYSGSLQRRYKYCQVRLHPARFVIPKCGNHTEETCRFNTPVTGRLLPLARTP